MFCTTLLTLFLFLFPAPAHATVYGWKEKGGVMYFSNSAEDVPEAYREGTRTFTSKLAEKERKAAEAGPKVSPPVESMPTESAYTQGFEKGLGVASQQVQIAGELARKVLESVPRQAPPRMVVHGPTVVVMRSPYSYAWHPYAGYGYIGPYIPYSPYLSFGYPYSFGYGRFLPHSHFFPYTRARRSGFFFPRGHSSHHGFLFGHGFFVE